MKLGVSSYSFQQYIGNGKLTQLDTVRRAAEMGFEGIEFIDLAPKKEATLADQLAYAKEIRKEAEKCGIAIIAYTIGANLCKGSPEENEKEVERLCRQLDVAAELGVPLMRHDVCYSECVNGKTVGFSRMLPVIAENARRVTEYAQTLGIRTCTENHGLIAQDADRVEALWSRVDHDNYGLLIDMGNFACADEDSVRAVSRLAPYAFHVHAKDFHIYPWNVTPPADARVFSSRGCRKLAGCAIGDGDIPIAHCLAVLQKAGYDGWISVEYEGVGDCIEGITRGKAYLQNCLSSL